MIEKFTIDKDRIYINGVELLIPVWCQSFKYYAYGNLRAGKPVDCGVGYFVVGDVSRDSFDSRYVGPITLDNFRSRVCCILSPPSR